VHAMSSARRRANMRNPSVQNRAVAEHGKKLRNRRGFSLKKLQLFLSRRWPRLAEFERELIRARTTEGRERAKARGVHMGRPPKLTKHQKKEAIKRRDHGEETLAEIGRSYNVSGWTIARLAL
jgi:hypothetical protein